MRLAPLAMQRFYKSESITAAKALRPFTLLNTSSKLEGCR
jgi:hypothetical protein